MPAPSGSGGTHDHESHAHESHADEPHGYDHNERDPQAPLT